MSENNNVKVFLCPICGKSFMNIHDYAKHISEHSEEPRRKAEEEEKQRKADQKKLDEDAYTNYIKAKEKYVEDYGEETTSIDLSDLFDILSLPRFRSWS